MEGMSSLGKGKGSRPSSSASFPAIVWLLRVLLARTGKLHRCAVTKNRCKLTGLMLLTVSLKNRANNEAFVDGTK